ncbi:MAG: hypothetical protein KJ970_14410 [Candidatus Eisenbacteria bacterium]|uniref:Chemotaxis protein CheC n=1 Tax=Eiseniibacteriota bacterium TaxID=2212470 RepID=A0A948W7D1_UNCEI|nr:hypothetical protein [Candidatus Eisenbacteria bacterium]MBU1949147.1 hypothetical protein [Candidatus Eisenbacteria bacterium]MBU2692110.1 hypothetical protein [Candidatus Eisenbacteria bacterium]
MILNETQNDIITELITIGLGHAGGQLNEMFGFHVRLNIPLIEQIPPSKLAPRLPDHLGDWITSVHMDFSGGIDGSAYFIANPDSSKKLIAALYGEDNPAPEDGTDGSIFDPEGAFAEVGNILINSILGSVANGLQRRFIFTIPKTEFCNIHTVIQEIGAESMDNPILVARTGFTIEELLLSDSVCLLFKIGSMIKFIEALDNVQMDL